MAVMVAMVLAKVTPAVKENILIVNVSPPAGTRESHDIMVTSW
jgi:hypothetical protein